MPWSQLEIDFYKSIVIQGTWLSVSAYLQYFIFLHINTSTIFLLLALSCATGDAGGLFKPPTYYCSHLPPFTRVTVITVACLSVCLLGALKWAQWQSTASRTHLTIMLHCCLVVRDLLAHSSPPWRPFSSESTLKLESSVITIYSESLPLVNYPFCGTCLQI